MRDVKFELLSQKKTNMVGGKRSWFSGYPVNGDIFMIRSYTTWLGGLRGHRTLALYIICM